MVDIRQAYRRGGRRRHRMVQVSESGSQRKSSSKGNGMRVHGMNKSHRRMAKNAVIQQEGKAGRGNRQAG